jgi:hypothetical protein
MPAPAARVASDMGAADILLAEAFLRLEGVCRELVKLFTL